MSVSARLLTLLALLAGLLAPLGSAPAQASAQASAQADAAHRTRVVVRIAHCEGCEVSLQQGLRNRWWSTTPRRIHDGRAVFVVPSGRTRGLSVSVTGTWEASSPHPSGFQAIATLRYGGVAAGERVTFAQARTKRRGSVCFPGTTADRLVLRLNARKVRVAGNGGPALTTLAWADPQVRTMAGTQGRVYGGVFGAQDIVPCS